MGSFRIQPQTSSSRLGGLRYRPGPTHSTSCETRLKLWVFGFQPGRLVAGLEREDPVRSRAQASAQARLSASSPAPTLCSAPSPALLPGRRARVATFPAPDSAPRRVHPRRPAQARRQAVRVLGGCYYIPFGLVGLDERLCRGVLRVPWVQAAALPVAFPVAHFLLSSEEVANLVETLGS